MNRRIRTIRKKLRLSQEEFAGKIGLTQNTVSYLEKKGSTVKEYNIKAICIQFGVSEVWLRSGEGEMFLLQDRRRSEIHAIFEQLSPMFQEHLTEMARSLQDASLLHQRG